MDLLGWRDYFLWILLAGHTLPSVVGKERQKSMYSIDAWQEPFERGVGVRQKPLLGTSAAFKGSICASALDFNLHFRHTKVQYSRRGCLRCWIAPAIKCSLLIGISRSAIRREPMSFAKASAESLKLGIARDLLKSNNSSLPSLKSLHIVTQVKAQLYKIESRLLAPKR